MSQQGGDALHARLAAREEVIGLLEEGSRWLQTHVFGRALQNTVPADRYPDQAWLFNEIEVLAQAPVAWWSAG